MKKIIVLVLLLKLTAIVAQEKSLQVEFLSSQPAPAGTFLGADSFGYSYSKQNNQLFKYNATEIKTYKNIQLGQITKVDLINPLRIVLFYEDFNTVVLLDNQLNETSVINLSEKSTIVAAGVGMASQNQLWIYNSLNQQIGLYNYLNNDYKNISVPLKNDSRYYQTDFNSFFWIDNDQNWFRCDLFGKITLLDQVPSFDKIQFINDHEFLYKKGNQLYLRTIDKTKTLSEIPIPISEKSFENFYYKDQILAIFTASEKINYKIILP